MDKIWLSQYPEGVADTINADQFPSLGALFESSARSYATKPAYTNLGVTYSYSELEAASRNFAAYLQNELGLGKGHKLALMLPNLLQYPIALFGALRAGLTLVNVNPLYTARELEHQLRDSAADAIVILANFADTLAEVREKVAIQHVIVTEVGDACPMPKRALVNLAVRYIKRMVPDYRIPEAVSWTGAMSAGRKYSFRPVAVEGDDIAFLQYTGGTTGVAKGAMLSHRNMVANVLQCTAWFQPFLGKGEETIVTALPLYHIFSLCVNCLTFARIGGHNLLITNPRDMKGFVKTLSKTPFTAITGVNTLFNGLLNTPGFGDLDFSNLHLSIGGGMAVHESVATRWQQVTGMPLLEGYGLTETAPVVAVMPLDAKAYSGKIGLPVPSTEVSIRDEDGKELGPDEPGELFVRGPQVMLGYLGRPEATANSLGDDGWFATGDMASIDDRGYLKIVDRKKDMILVSGFNVYPNEIEDVVAAHPGVFEVAAIGVPDDVKGEVVKIVVVRSDPGLTEEELINYCRDNLTGYKVPKIVEFREEIPKSNVGKILRRELRDGQGS